jgi:BlaI family transcriptional regulator, penicillinase repressor
MPKDPSISPPPAISDSEWLIMSEFWRLGEATVKTLMTELEERQSWKITTVQTLINRLVTKRALGRRKEGREFIYHPLVDEKHCTHAASRSFMDRVFGGKLAPLLATFMERHECSPEDLAELKRLLEDKSNEPQ